MNAPDLCPMLRLLLTERQAAAALGVSTDTLRREGKRRRVGYAMIAGRPRYTEQHLAAHIHAQEVKPCNESDNPTVPARSAIAGSPGVQTALCGAGRGSTPRLDKLAEHHSALSILQPQGSRSRGGSPTTAPHPAPAAHEEQKEERK
jgi:hypothetical protein